MKLYYLAYLHVPSKNASGLQIMQTCKAIAELGHDVEVVVLNSAPSVNAIFDYYCVTPSFRIKTFYIKKFFRTNPKFSMKVLSRIGLLLMLIRATVYLAQRQGGVIYTRIPLAGIFTRNAVLEVHTLPKNFSFLNRYIFSRFKQFVCITHSLKERLIKEGLDDNRILVAPDGVDISKFDVDISKSEARKLLEISADEKVIVYSGSLTSLRSFQFLRVIDEMPISVDLYIVGRVDKRIVGSLSKFTNIHLIGQRPHEEIPLWQKSSDALLLFNTAKSKTLRCYTSPMKLFEYMVSGRPIIASDLPSTREILSERSSLLVVPDSASALAKGIEKVFSDESYVSGLAKQARIDVEKYSWTNRAGLISEFVRSDLEH